MCNNDNYKEERGFRYDEFHVLPEEEIQSLTPEQRERYYKMCNEKNENERKRLIAQWNAMDEEKKKERMKAQR